MKKITISIIAILSIILYTGCATKLPVLDKSALIVVKTPTMRYADMGFISKYDNRTKVQIYGLGQPVLSFDIYKDNICMSMLECMSKSEFNSKVLSKNYTDNTLENIFNGEPIFGGENMSQNSNGFTQKIIKDGVYEIEYTVANKKIAFNDKINKITIKVEEQ